MTTSVACGEPLSPAGARKRVVTGLPEHGEYLFEVTAPVNSGAVIEWPKRAPQLQLPVTQELAGPSGADTTVTGEGPLVTACGPGDGLGVAPPQRPWQQSQIVGAEHLTHFPGNGWAPGSKALLRPGPDSGWELKLHTSCPFVAHYVYEPAHAVPEEITVTNRGRPVARRVPHLRQPRRSRLEEMTARGDATPAKRDITDLPRPLPALPGRSLSEVLLEMREEER
ncbi:hypothetical protein [Candidatus Poriferisodalis sp.]|uniref:hypothetical protein n=1 Tax=Candidatus Poriferisodalis sp. TaxID=3101277 RepID=UPI003B01E5D0